MDSARWTRMAIGLAVGAVVGVVLYASGQVWPLAAAAGVIAADVVYAGLTLAQTGAWGPMRVAAGLVAFAVATYIGIGFGDFNDPNAVDPNTFANSKAANSWAKGEEGKPHYAVIASEFARAATERNDAAEAQRWNAVAESAPNKDGVQPK